MDIEGFKINKYVAGWSVDTPYEGQDKDGNPKTQYRQTYYPNLKQCLGKVREEMAKDCQSVTELISLLETADSMDKRVLAANGLI
ncbi:hypothetical protein OAA60_03105 [Porticoccaceae bacterium]|nr:hypothetical protein [Porticoccaceae bacterium]